MSHDLRKSDFCLCENKSANQGLCSCYMDSKIPAPLQTCIQNFKILAFFCGSIGRFVSDLVGNPEDQFSRVTVHIGTVGFLMIRYIATAVAEKFHSSG